MIQLTIPGEPMGKQRPKVWNGHGVTPDKTVNYETLVKEIFAMSGQQMMDGELRAEITAYFSVAPSTPKKKMHEMLAKRVRPTKKPDSDNIGKICLDSLNKMAYHDDSQIVSLQVDKYFDATPRVEIRITEV